MIIIIISMVKLTQKEKVTIERTKIIEDKQAKIPKYEIKVIVNPQKYPKIKRGKMPGFLKTS